MKKIFYVLMLVVLFYGCKKDEPGSIKGSITDKSTGEAIKDAEVQLSTGTKVLTNETGEYEFAEVKAGDYTLTVTKTDYTTISGYQVAVEADKVTTVNLQMEKTETEPEEIEGMVFVRGGTFTMGCTDEQGDDCFDWELPSHQVTVSDFYIGKYEVTQKEWREVMGTNPSYFTGDNLPVEQVSWDDVQEFITKLNEQTGKNYRLPTEAEWEFAARGGNQSQGYKYSGSDNADLVAWYYENSNGTTHAVGTKQANELGIYDMSGNVWEWCSDWYGGYTADSQVDPTGPVTGSGRVRRGGDWGSNTRSLRVSDHSDYDPDSRSANLGFRLACSSN